MKKSQGPLFIGNGQLIDGTGAAAGPDATLVIQDGVITYVGAAAGAPAPPPDAERIDALGGTIMPGLVDVLVVDGDPIRDIAALEDRARFLAVLQGGVVKAGTLAKPFPTVVTREK